MIVEKGKVLHIDGEGNEIVLEEGDVITISERLPHKVKNLTEKEAILTICFSKGERKLIEL